MLPCLAISLLVGQLLTLHPNGSHPSSFDAPYAELQSCDTGPGVFVMGSGSELMAGGIQYGAWYRRAGWRVGLQPFFGASYTPREVPELPGHAQFWVGANAAAVYNRYTVGIKYGHGSSAGLTERNAGVDLVGVFCGYAFGE